MDDTTMSAKSLFNPFDEARILYIRLTRRRRLNPSDAKVDEGLRRLEQTFPGLAKTMRLPLECDRSGRSISTASSRKS